MSSGGEGVAQMKNIILILFILTVHINKRRISYDH